MKTQIIDLSALYWRNWHASDGDEVSSARRRTLGFVRSLYARGDVIVALDSPPYKRSSQYPDYKKNRPPRNEAAIEQLERCVKEIKNDGWTIAFAPGYEADDVIYTLLKKLDDADVYGSDKDLLQCCDVIEPWTGNVKTPENTLGVRRNQVVDFLTLVGDSSDNIPGVRGVGRKRAQDLLDRYGDVNSVMNAIIHKTEQFGPKTVQAFTDASAWIDTTINLIRLQDCSETLVIEKKTAIVPKEENIIDSTVQPSDIKPVPKSTAIAVQHEQLGFRQSLEPIGITECWRVAEAVFQSRLYSKFPNAQAIMVTIMRGRALGLDATTALDGIHVIQGKPTMAASLMVGLVLASKKCEYLYCSDTSDDSATWTGKRVGMPNDISRKYSMDDAHKMCITGKDNWGKQPATMLKWRAASRIIRELFPDVINGLYATEEME